MEKISKEVLQNAELIKFISCGTLLKSYIDKLRLLADSATKNTSTLSLIAE
jgi:hypothetical protein